MSVLSVVIPSRNGKDILERFLPAIARETAATGGELIVVNDCSTDGTAELVTGEFPHAKLLERDTEPAFCRAVNLGMSQSDGDYLLLLNNDTIPQKGSFRMLLEALQGSDENVAAVVPRIPRPDGTDDSLFGWGFKRGLAVTGTQRGFQRYPSGACALWRRTAWEHLGGLDCRYAPIYWEDADMGARMHMAGYTMTRCPMAVVKHLHRATMGSSPASDAIRERNRLIFMHSRCGGLKMRLSTLLWMPLHIAGAHIRGNRAFLEGRRLYRSWRRNQ